MGGVKIDLLIAHVLLVIHEEIERVNAQRTDMFVHMKKKNLFMDTVLDNDTVILKHRLLIKQL